MIKVTPLRSYLLVQPEEPPPMSTIIHVQADEKQPQRGLVLRVGETVEDIQVADRILYNMAVGIKTGVEETLLVPESAVYLRIVT